jgi:uncharacterized peroxidase-related enzyme
MPFIETIPETDAAGPVAALYANDREESGHVRNLTTALSLAPEVVAAWQALNAAIKARMDLRRYELATLAAARRLRSSYCALAHGSVLLDNFVDAETLESIMADHHEAGLDEVDIAVMDLADKVVADASSVTQEDIDRLRALGLSDGDVLDVIAAAAARCFFSKLLDGIGAQPDEKYTSLPDGVRKALTVGRPIAAAAAG